MIPAGRLRGVPGREQKDEVGARPVGDEHLAPREEVAVRDGAVPRGEVRGVGPHRGFGEAEGAQPPALSQGDAGTSLAARRFPRRGSGGPSLRGGPTGASRRPRSPGRAPRGPPRRTGCRRRPRPTPGIPRPKNPPARSASATEPGIWSSRSKRTTSGWSCSASRWAFSRQDAARDATGTAIAGRFSGRLNGCRSVRRSDRVRRAPPGREGPVHLPRHPRHRPGDSGPSAVPTSTRGSTPGRARGRSPSVPPAKAVGSSTSFRADMPPFDRYATDHPEEPGRWRGSFVGFCPPPSSRTSSTLAANGTSSSSSSGATRPSRSGSRWSSSEPATSLSRAGGPSSPSRTRSPGPIDRSGSAPPTSRRHPGESVTITVAELQVALAGSRFESGEHARRAARVRGSIGGGAARAGQPPRE